MERNMLNALNMIELKLMRALDKQEKDSNITNDLLDIIEDYIYFTKELIEIVLKGE